MQAAAAAATAATLALWPAAATGPVRALDAQAVAVPDHCARSWPGVEADIEAHLKSGKVLRLETVPIGVTRPQRAVLAPGGPAAQFAWKPLAPAVRNGYRESYKAEIAAYLLDRLLDLHMVPPVVEREVNGTTGAAVYWIEQTKPWDKDHPPQGPEPGWSRQVSTMKLFDQLIANSDRNQGNLLYDDGGHVFLIDHSRAFTSKPDLAGLSAPQQYDRDLWLRMAALTRQDVDAVVGAWLTPLQIECLLERRDKMAKQITRLLRERGERLVFLPRPADSVMPPSN
jgi:hypothetical protein